MKAITGYFVSALLLCPLMATGDPSNVTQHVERRINIERQKSIESKVRRLVRARLSIEPGAQKTSHSKMAATADLLIALSEPATADLRRIIVEFNKQVSKPPPLTNKNDYGVRSMWFERMMFALIFDVEGSPKLQFPEPFIVSDGSLVMPAVGFMSGISGNLEETLGLPDKSLRRRDLKVFLIRALEDAYGEQLK